MGIRRLGLTEGAGMLDCDMCEETFRYLRPCPAQYEISEPDTQGESEVIGYLCDHHARQWDNMDEEYERRQMVARDLERCGIV